MDEGNLLILEFVSQGRLSVDDAVALIEALADDAAPEVWVVPLLAEDETADVWIVPLPAEMALDVCMS